MSNQRKKTKKEIAAERRDAVLALSTLSESQKKEIKEDLDTLVFTARKILAQSNGVFSMVVMDVFVDYFDISLFVGSDIIYTYNSHGKGNLDDIKPDDFYVWDKKEVE